MGQNARRSDKPVGYRSVVAIGVGGMVGGGIFAMLGLAVQLAHGGTPVAFLLAGVVALLTSYSYVQTSEKQWLKKESPCHANTPGGR